MKRNRQKSLSGAVKSNYFIFNTLLILIFGISMLFISTRILIEKVQTGSERNTEQSANLLDKSFTDITSQMVNFSSYHDILNRLGKTSLTVQERLDLDRELNNILKKTNLFNSVVQDIFLIADNGYVFSTATQSGLAANYLFWDQLWYQEAKNTEGNIYVRILGLYSQDFYGSTRMADAEKDTYAVSFALENTKGKVIGALIYTIDQTQVTKILESCTYEKHGEMAVLSSEGMVLSHSIEKGIGTSFQTPGIVLQEILQRDRGNLWTQIEERTHYVSYRRISLGMYVVSYVPRSELLAQTYTMIILTMLAIVICLFINWALAYHVTVMIRTPVNRLKHSIQAVNSEHLQIDIDCYEYEELNQIAEKFSTVLDRLDTMIEKDYKSRILINKFRLYSLQSQINPHFLMNTLQQLQTEIVYGNVEESNETILSLSRMLRYSLYQYEAMVPISQELQYIQSYLALFMKKYEGELKAEYRIEEQVRKYYMPKMIIQPLVENCIMHAFGEDPRNAFIQICVMEIPTSGSVSISIEDNGIGMEEKQLELLREDLEIPEVDNRRIGIRNIHQRIRLLYGERYGITISSEIGKGSKFEICFPRIEHVEAANNEDREI